MIQCEICGKEFKDAQGLAGHMQFKHNESGEKPRGAQLPAKPLPVDFLIRELQLPDISDGTREVFDAGVTYGMKAIIVGVRLAQELSAMGIQQAKPVMEMAKEMRQAEGQAAEVAASQAAAEAAERVAAYFDQKKPDIAATPNPMMGVMARTMETLLNNIVGKMTGGVQSGQAQLPPGWVDERQQGGQSS